jgi:hypothetical protein
MKMAALAPRTWSAGAQTATEPDAVSQLLIIDLRQEVKLGTQAALTDLVQWCVREFAVRSQSARPTAVVVRHTPAGSGRISASFFSELALCAVRAFVRQMRYDRGWKAIPLTFVDARDASDEEIAGVTTALLSSASRLDVDRSSGLTAGAGWKLGDSI